MTSSQPAGDSSEDPWQHASICAIRIVHEDAFKGLMKHFWDLIVPAYYQTTSLPMSCRLNSENSVYNGEKQQGVSMSNFPLHGGFWQPSPLKMTSPNASPSTLQTSEKGLARSQGQVLHMNDTRMLGMKWMKCMLIGCP